MISFLKGIRENQYKLNDPKKKNTILKIPNPEDFHDLQNTKEFANNATENENFGNFEPMRFSIKNNSKT